MELQKIERGVMVMKDYKAWGVKYADGHCTSYGWVDPVNAPIHKPEFCKRPQDVTYTGSPDIRGLSTAQLVMVERKTILTIITEKEK